MEKHTGLGTVVPVDETIDKSSKEEGQKPKSKWAHLSVSVDFASGRETVTRVPEIRRPYEQRHFRIHPDFEIPRVPIFIDALDHGQVYILTDEISKMLPVADRKWANIYAAVTSDDITFFHYRRITASEENIWSRTANNIIEMARAGWIRTTVAPGGGYEVHHPTDPKFCAKVPAWPADLDDAFGVALNGVNGKGGQQITSAEHRVVCALLRRD